MRYTPWDDINAGDHVSVVFKEGSQSHIRHGMYVRGRAEGAIEKDRGAYWFSMITEDGRWDTFCTRDIRAVRLLSASKPQPLSE